MGGLAGLQKTSGAKWILVLRVLAGAPLLLFGLMHLLGMQPIRPLIDAAGMPAPGLMEYLGPLLQAGGGLLLLTGSFTRLGAILAIGAMLGAIYTHIRIPNDQWPTPTEADPSALGPEPTEMMFMAIGFIVLSLVLLVVGGGRWSVDSRMSSSPAPPPSSPADPAPQG